MQYQGAKGRPLVCCPRYASCDLPAGLSMTAALRIWQSLYCEAAWERCERRRRLEAGESVPANFLPDGRVFGALPRSTARSG